MGKTSNTSKDKGAGTDAPSVKYTERTLRGLLHLQPRARGRASRLTIPGFQKMVKTSQVGLPVWSSALHMSATGLERRMARKTGFDALESDRLLTVEQVLKRGMEVFEDADDLNAWLERKHRLLGDQRPMDLLGSTAGIGMVLMELGRIEHGVF